MQLSPPPLKSGPPAAPKFIEPRFKRDSEITQEAIEARRLALDIFFGGAQARLGDPSLISSSHGAIKKVLLTLPNDLFSTDDPQTVKTAETVKDLLPRLGAGVELIIVTQDSSAPQLNQWLSQLGLAGRTTTVLLSDNDDITIWAQDPVAVCRDLSGPETFLVEPIIFNRLDDAFIADFVADGTTLKRTDARLHFQGGNILIGDDFWLIGMDSAAESFESRLIEQNSGETAADAIKRKYGESLDLKRRLIPVGSRRAVPLAHERGFQMNGQPWTEKLYFGNKAGTAQPIFHIDMFLTLAGRNATEQRRVLIGDPAMAAKILGQGPPPRHAMAAIFDDIAQQFSAMGFEVIRNPLPLTYDDNQEKRERTWYFASSNNALVEITDESKQVWLPTYGHDKWPELAETDNANKKIWENLGFTVNMLKNFHPFASQVGAVHCILKYLSRG